LRRYYRILLIGAKCIAVFMGCGAGILLMMSVANVVFHLGWGMNVLGGLFSAAIVVFAAFAFRFASYLQREFFAEDRYRRE
jgi:membrane protein implicated in regulation of membrane protease activity